LIVTGRYHMPRTMQEFSSALPDKSLIAYPVDQSRIDLGGWWRHPTRRNCCIANMSNISPVW
jgi:uncharacterized SAM-binding protein YcdF (DUF218 family)